ncbi:MAG: hypothetical protein IIB03_04300 [Acidobacteria bacterium]|nr:hypothetical protein [Acidobacteriota bacterium]
MIRIADDFLVFGGDGGVNQFTAHNVGNSTNFNDGVAAACSIVGASSQANKFVMFMSDGTADGGSNVGTPACAAVCLPMVRAMRIAACYGWRFAVTLGLSRSEVRIL